ncbi:MAG: tRNA-dihydrouridine synthase, partial [Promethearchaeota archaeon]
ALKERLSIPIVGNGNIIEPKSAKFFIDFTNVDAFMVGRESMGNPEIFYQIHEYLVKKKLVLFKNDKENMRNNFRIYEETVDDYFNDISHPIGNQKIKFMELKRNAIWLSKNIDKSSKLRTMLSKTKDYVQLKELLENFFLCQED